LAELLLVLFVLIHTQPFFTKKVKEEESEICKIYCSHYLSIKKTQRQRPGHKFVYITQQSLTKKVKITKIDICECCFHIYQTKL